MIGRQNFFIRQRAPIQASPRGMVECRRICCLRGSVHVSISMVFELGMIWTALEADKYAKQEQGQEEKDAGNDAGCGTLAKMSLRHPANRSRTRRRRGSQQALADCKSSRYAGIRRIIGALWRFVTAPGDD